MVLSATIGAASWPLFTASEKVNTGLEILDVLRRDFGQRREARRGVVLRGHGPLAVIGRCVGGARRGATGLRASAARARDRSAPA